MNRMYANLAIAAVAVPLALDARAQDGPSIGVGEADLYPALRIDYLRDSNAFRTSEDEVEASAFVLRPEAQLIATRRLLRLRASYVGAYADYDEDALDYADHDFEVRGDVEFSRRQRATLVGGVRVEHEELGTRRTLGAGTAVDELVEYQRLFADGSYTYGNAAARGNITLGAIVANTRYTSQEARTEGDDYSLLRPSAIFSYRLSPDTRALTVLRFGRYLFDDERNDRSDISLLGGISLGETEKRGGSARIGGTLSQFDESGRDDETSLVLEAELFYLPLSYSRLALFGERQLDNFAGTSDGLVGQQAIRNELILSWEHAWSSRWSSVAQASYLGLERDCPDLNRDTFGVELELGFQLRRWLELGVGGGTFERSASLCEEDERDESAFEYSRQFLGVHVRATL